MWVLLTSLESVGFEQYGYKNPCPIWHWDHRGSHVFPLLQSEDVYFYLIFCSSPRIYDFALILSDLRLASCWEPYVLKIPMVEHN